MVRLFRSLKLFKSLKGLKLKHRQSYKTIDGTSGKGVLRGTLFSIKQIMI